MLKGIIKVLSKAPTFVVKPALKGVVHSILNKYANIKIHNPENLNKINAPVIFICNHLSNADGLVLNKILKKYNPYFVAGVKLNETSMSKLGLEIVNIIPIKANSADVEALKKCIEAIKEEKNILIFPEGTRSRTGAMIEGKKGIVLIARKANVPIVPIAMWGTEKLMPINDNNMGEEVFQHADVNISIGEPFTLPKFNKEVSKEEFSQNCLDIIMNSIASQLPDEYKGVHK
ncbi:lysophospholipid acyltransferase family protein [Clostridium cylindrosporum]|uniref:1-acyl-sn-glycerol-3-phosphate acyltransferase n=1 Tax=Clostridium cylindrosporum DSM 605 TaxID=1121307 RepID=A0A0J8D4S9_CLOCY|nr:lysophospholipid acyltransferase family protein [Clostridium cylindrosporum]KMT20822.1 1-acyl-sn-glycerol-3-phosphate acyltransferase [Clostridium cylindrosporum DSM 605]